MRLEAWLAARTGKAPAKLRERVQHHARGTPDAGPLDENLAAAADRVLASVERHPGDRSVALDLLAADALITLALLARAETAPDQLAEFATGLLRSAR